jgi:hypothetical protein
LRQNNIHLRVKNTFEPDHSGTLITRDYVSDSPCVEIVAGRMGVYAIELFDQDMVGDLSHYEEKFLGQIMRFKAQVINKDLNANTITHYLSANLKTVKRIQAAMAELFPDAEINVRKVCIVSAIGSDLKIPGMLARTAKALADAGDFVGWQIVDDDDAARLHLGDEAFLQPLLEDHAGHGTRQQLRGEYGVMGQAGQERRRHPVAVWGFADKFLALLTPAMRPRHGRLGAGFVDEHQR